MSRDPFYSAGPAGSRGRPDMKQTNQFASSSSFDAGRGNLRNSNKTPDGGLFERFSAAMNSAPDTRFARVVAKFNKFLRW
jgi:hypothetical protein